MDALMTVNVGVQTGAQGFFQLKTVLHIAWELLMLNKATKNKGSYIEADWQQGP